MLPKRASRMACIIGLIAAIAVVTGCQKSKFESLSYKIPDGWVAVTKDIGGTKVLTIGLANSSNPSEPIQEQAIEVSSAIKAPENRTIENHHFSSYFRKEVRQVFREAYQQSGTINIDGNKATTYSLVERISEYTPPESDNIISDSRKEFQLLYFPSKKMKIKLPKGVQDQSGLREFLDSLSF